MRLCWLIYMDKGAPIVIPTSPTNQPQAQPQQQKEPKKTTKKPKGEGTKESKKKQSDANKAQAKPIQQAQPAPLEENQSDEVQEIGFNPNSAAKRMEPTKQYEEELLKNAGVLLSGAGNAFSNIDLQSMMKQYGLEQMANVFPNPASLPPAGLFGNIMGGFKQQDLEQILGMMPNRNMPFPMNPNNLTPTKKP